MSWFEELAKQIEVNGGKREIHRFNEDGSVKLYLERFYIEKTLNHELMLHRFWLSDFGSHLHNHPWDSSSYILKTGYWEHTKEGRFWRNPNYHGNRLANDYHMVELEKGTEGEVWSLFSTGKRIQTWGYLTENGFMHFKEYHKLKGIDSVQQYPEQYSNGLFPIRLDSI